MQPFYMTRRIAWAFIFALIVSGCGGGGGDEPTNSAPDAITGIDQTVTEGTTVTLDGSASADSDGTIVSYTWSQVSGTPVNLSGANSVRATFQAPELTADTTLVFQLQVEDDDGATATDSVSVTVMDVVAPDAIAGIDQTVTEGTTVTLDGSASTDPDGTIVSYTWSQVSGTPVNLSAANSVRATFQAPELTADTTLVFRLQVQDDDGARDTDEVSVTIVSASVVDLTVSIFGDGTVQIAGQHSLECDVPHLCHAIVPEDDDVVLEALPTSGYAIDGWSGCDSASNDTCTVVANRDRLVSVYFISTEPLQLKDDVVAFDADRVEEIEDFDMDSGLLVMRATADISDLQIDDVIVSNVIDPDRDFPTYFLRRIRDIQKLPGGTGYIRTVQATLEDLIASGSLLSGSTPLDLSDVTSYELPEGVTWTGPALGPSGGPSTLWEPLGPKKEASLAISFCFTPDLCVRGNVALAIKPDFALDAGLLKGIREFKAAVSVTPSAQVKAVAKATIGRSFKRDLPIKLRFTPIAVGPVVLVPEVTPQLEITVEASTGFEPNIKVGFRMTGGAHYRKGSGWAPISEYESLSKATPGTDSFTGVSADLEAAFLVEFATKLYGIAGPTVSAGPYAGIGVFTLDPPQGECTWDWAWYYGGRAQFGGKFQIFKIGLSYTVTLFDYQVKTDEHRQDCSDDESPPGAPSGLTFGDVSDSSLTLRWTASMDDSGDVSYKVLRKPSTSVVSRAFSNVAEATLYDRGLRANTQYCYQVIAIDKAGNESPPSPAACMRTASRDTDMAGTPSRVRVDPLSPSVVSVSWSPPPGAAVERYVVYEWPQSGASPAALLETEALSAKVSGLNPGTDYCFGVAAVKKGGTFSEISGMTCDMTPDAEAAPWRLLIACAGADYNFEEPFDLDEESTVSVISVTGAGNDYDGTPLTYAITGTYSSQAMILDGRIDWSFQHGGRRIDEFTADLSTVDTGDITMDRVFPRSGGCTAVIRFTMGGGVQGSVAAATVQPPGAVLLSGATFSGQ